MYSRIMLYFFSIPILLRNLAVTLLDFLNYLHCTQIVSSCRIDRIAVIVVECETYYILLDAYTRGLTGLDLLVSYDKTTHI